MLIIYGFFSSMLKKLLLLLIFLALYQSAFIPVQASTYLSGDFNRDGQVDLRDYNTFVHNFLRTYPYCEYGWNIAEMTQNCQVDLADYTVFIHNFLRTAPLPPKKSALIIINEDDFQTLTTTLTDLKNDVEQKLPVKVKFVPIYDLRHKTPDFVRDILISECGNIDPQTGCEHIEGAVFVGDVPYAHYDQIHDDNHSAPFMFFYQDLDSTFHRNANSHYSGYETFGAHEGPEIYISWIKTETVSLLSPVEQLQRYFEKHHRFFTGEVIPQQSMTVALHCPIVYEREKKIFGALLDKYGIDNIILASPSTTCDDLSSVKFYVRSLFARQQEVFYLHSHGDESYIWDLSSNDFRISQNLPLFALSWGCRNGSWENPSGIPPVSIAFINGNDLGLAYLGKLDNSDIPNEPPFTLGRFAAAQVVLFNYWGQGMYLGQALLQQQQDYANLGITYDPSAEKLNLYRESGPLQRALVGSPFIYPQQSLFLH